MPTEQALCQLLPVGRLRLLSCLRTRRSEHGGGDRQATADVGGGVEAEVANLVHPWRQNVQQPARDELCGCDVGVVAVPRAEANPVAVDFDEAVVGDGDAASGAS